MSTRVAAPSEDRDLFARAARIRKLIADGVVDPWDGLYYVICPTPAILEREATQSPSARHSVIYRERRAG